MYLMQQQQHPPAVADLPYGDFPYFDQVGVAAAPPAPQGQIFGGLCAGLKPGEAFDPSVIDFSALTLPKQHRGTKKTSKNNCNT